MLVRWGIISTVIASLVFTGSASASPNAQAPAPSPDTLRQVTTAMLQPGDVSARLGGPGEQNIGYNIPPGGQDPYPICQGNLRREVVPDLTMAIGYFSTVGQVTQSVYQYPTASKARSAWERLQRDITRGCGYSRDVDSSLIRVSNGSAAAVSGMWTLRSTTGSNPSGEYTQVAPAGDSIIALRFNAASAPTTAAQRQALGLTMQTLVSRFSNREVSSGVQSTSLSIAEAAMLTTADMPPTLPVRSPSDGAWSSFTANLPGQAPFNQCNPQKDLMPAGTGSFSVTFGDDGGPVLTDGFAWQQVFTYVDSDSADAAWASLTKAWEDCNERFGELYKKTKPARRGTAGVSPVVVDGTPGLYYQYIETQGSDDQDFRWSTRTYQLFLKDGNVISSVTYGISLDGIKRVSVDEPAVNQLAVELLDRFTNTVVTTP